MKITLDANPSNAPCCIRIEAENGEDRLIQTDWDYPGIASSFGWLTQMVQACQHCNNVATDHEEEIGKECNQCGELTGLICQHSCTDGTVDCKECGCTASQFIAAARQWIDDNDGAQAEDPGYFQS